MAGEIKELTQCPVCFESYDENGDHIPRILPCHCTLCQSCIGRLIKNNVLECPQDRAKHAANKGVKSFSQNKYILAYLKRELKEKDLKYEECQEHNMKIVLFCKDESCQLGICPVCMSENHISHDVVNILGGEKKKLNEKIDPLIQNLYIYNEQILTAKQKIEQESDKIIKQVKTRKEELFKELDEKVVNNNDNITTLNDIREKTSKSKSHSDIKNKIEFVELIEDLSRTNDLSHEYKFYKLVETEQKLEQHVQVCRETAPQQISLNKKVVPNICVSKGKIFPECSNKR